MSQIVYHYSDQGPIGGFLRALVRCLRNALFFYSAGVEFFKVPKTEYRKSEKEKKNENRAGECYRRTLAGVFFRNRSFSFRSFLVTQDFHPTRSVLPFQALPSVARPTQGLYRRFQSKYPGLFHFYLSEFRLE